MKNRVIYVAISYLLLLCEITFSNDGAAALTTGGIQFIKSEHISLESEILTISPHEIKVVYAFKNNTNNDITHVVAFPMPDIICDPFSSMNYPEHFTALVNGQKIDLSIEIKAIVREKVNKYEVGQDVTKILLDNNIPLDCRNINEVMSDDSDSGMSAEYIKLMDLGLACCDPKMDPWSIYYKTKIKYYWTQVFPASDIINIEHTYIPSLGSINGYYPNDPTRQVIEPNISLYQDFYIKNFKLDEEGKPFTIEDKRYSYLHYILSTANTWTGAIKEFRLILKNTGNFVVTNLDGPLILEKNDIVIKKENFIPIEDLYVFFFK